MKMGGQVQGVMMIYVSRADVSFWRETVWENVSESQRLDSERGRPTVIPFDASSAATTGDFQVGGQWESKSHFNASSGMI